MSNPFVFDLPPNWKPLALGYEPCGPDALWANAARGVLNRHGVSALAALDEVQDLVFRACEIDPDRVIRNPAWIAHLPEGAPKVAWGERSGRQGYRPGSLWTAVQEFRAVDDELSALAALTNHGWAYAEQMRDGGPDWGMSQSGRPLYLEVKSKGGIRNAIEVLYSTLVVAQLVDGSHELRKWDWTISEEQYDSISRFTYEGLLDPLIALLVEALPQVAQWLARDEDYIAFEENDVRVAVIRHGDDMFGVDVSSWRAPDDEQEGEWRARFEFYGERERGRWAFQPFLGGAEWNTDRVSSQGLGTVATLLTNLLLGAGDARGRQLASFPEDTLFVIHWIAPWWWDGALAMHAEDIHFALQAVERAAGAYRQNPAIGLWPDSFSAVANRIILNDAAQRLVGVGCIAMPWATL